VPKDLNYRRPPGFFGPECSEPDNPRRSRASLIWPLSAPGNHGVTELALMEDRSGRASSSTDLAIVPRRAPNAGRTRVGP
jgi:hypothetical protein